jgi:hypothetical protein
MDTPTKVIAAAGKIAAGNAAMITNGYTPIVDFSAASIATLLGTFNTLNGDKIIAKETHNVNIGTADTMRPLALGSAVQIQLEVENNFNYLDPATMHTFTVLWGLKYETAKTETSIKVICFLPGGLVKAAGAELRLGPVLTKEGKPSKEGVKGMADAEGEDTLVTTQEDLVYVNARLIGCADAHEPVTIVPGIAQTITVNFVIGISTL